VVGYLIWKHDHFIVMDIHGAEHHPDVLILQRLMHAGLANHIRLSQAYGQKVINDVDDWYWGLDPSNNAFKHSHPKFNTKENTNHYRSILSRSDLVTVSTPYLHERLRGLFKHDSAVMPNTVDIQRFTLKEHTDSTVPTVGWAGSTAHRSGDLETVAGIIKPMKRSGRINLLHVGDHAGAPSFASKLGLNLDEVETRPLVSSAHYPSSLVMDIGIVPLRVTPFNRAKSDIKGLEYSAAGVPFVAQQIDSYSELHATGVGRIAKRPMDWLRHIKHLAEDPLLRREEGLANRERIQSRDIKYGIQAWLDVLSSI
jgi:hypothetical protein